MNVPFCQVVNAGPLTSSENHDSSKKSVYIFFFNFLVNHLRPVYYVFRYRKSCNSCTKSKKKCDGGKNVKFAFKYTLKMYL